MAQAINAPLNVQVQNGRQLTQQVQASLNAVRLNLGNGKALSSLSQPLGRLTGQADEFTKSLDAANARVLAFGASVGIVNAFSNAFKSLVNSTIEVEKAIKAISVVGDQFNGKTKQLTQGLFNVAKVTGQSFAEVSKAALEFSRQGQNVEETLRRTQDALILTRLTGLDAAKAVEGLTAAANGFTKAGLNTTQILNKLVAVDQAFAVSSADLIEGFNRSAAVAENAGVTFDELAGIITVLQQKTSRGGAVIGNALKTIFTRLQDTSTLNQLQGLGIAVQDLQGNLLPARQILQNLAKDVEGLGQITKAGIFKDVAGAFQINQLISLVSDLNSQNSIAADATRKSTGATNEAFLANEKLSQSLDAIINKVSLTGQQLGSLIGELGLADSFKSILSGINGFLEGATDLLQGDDLGAKFAKGIVKGIGAVLTGPGLGIFLAVIGKLTLDLVKFGSQSIKAFFGIGQAAKQQQQIQESIVQTLLRNENVLRTILNTQGGQNAQAQAFLGILNQQEKALQSIRSLAGGIAAPVIAAGYSVGSEGGIQRRGRAAGGYLPAQEASDVRRGVGGASPNSKVVSIPNFAFGGGKRGTMIANTSEYIVPNYAGGGSAIFNQDMVKTMGLPAGAKKIGAAGGFIPNFAIRGLASNESVLAGRIFEALIRNDKYIDLTENEVKPDIPEGDPRDYGESEAKMSVQAALRDKNFGPGKRKGNVVIVPKDSSRVYDQELKEKKGSNIIRPIEDELSRANIFPIARKILKRESLQKQSSYSRIPLNASGGYIPNFAASNFTNDQLAVLGLYGNTGGDINGSPIYTLQSQRPDISRDISFEYAVRVKKMVRDYSKQIASKIPGLQVTPKSIQKAVQQKDNVSGFIFEDVMNQLAGPYFDSNKISGGSRADFPLTSNLRDIFNVIGAQKYAEVKLNPYSSSSRKSVAEKQKALADGATPPRELTPLELAGRAQLREDYLTYQSLASRAKDPNEYRRIVNALELNPTTQRETLNNQIETALGLRSFPNKRMIGGVARMRSAFGYVPNFVDLNKPEGYATKQRKKSREARTYRSASGVIGSLFKSLPEKFFVDGVLGDAVNGAETNGILKLVKDSSYYMASFGGPKALNFVSQVEKNGLKVSEGLKKKLAQLTVKVSSKIGRSSSGYMPNFAASALQEAIAREKNAGLSSSQIYVDQSSALKSASNPMGLMVANTRDEPSGGFQGIARARKEGANPKLYGAAKGFVPNYASQQTNSSTPNVAKVEKGFGDIAGKLIILQSALSFFESGFTEAGSVANKVSNAMQTLVTAVFAYQAAQSIGTKKTVEEMMKSNQAMKAWRKELYKTGQDIKKSGPRAQLAARGAVSIGPNTSKGTALGASYGTGKLADLKRSIGGGVRQSIAGSFLSFQSVAGAAAAGAIALKGFNDLAGLFYTRSSKLDSSLELLSSSAGKAAASLNDVDKASLKGATSALRTVGFGATLTKFLAGFNPANLGKEKVAYNYGGSVTISSLKGGQTQEDFVKVQEDLSSLIFTNLKTQYKDAPNVSIKNETQSKVASLFKEATQDGVLDLEKLFNLPVIQELVKNASDTNKKIDRIAAEAESKKAFPKLVESVEKIIAGTNTAFNNEINKINDFSEKIKAIQASKAFGNLNFENQLSINLSASTKEFENSFRQRQIDIVKNAQELIKNNLPDIVEGEDFNIGPETQEKIKKASNLDEVLSLLEVFQQKLGGIDPTKIKGFVSQLNDFQNSISTFKSNLDTRSATLKLEQEELIATTKAQIEFRDKFIAFSNSVGDAQRSLINLRGALERIDVQTQSRIDIRSAFATSRQQQLDIRKEETLSGLSKKQGAEATINLQEALIEARKQSFTEENFIALNLNTQAIKDLTTELLKSQGTDFQTKYNETEKAINNIVSKRMSEGITSEDARKEALAFKISGSPLNLGEQLNYYQNSLNLTSPNQKLIQGSDASGIAEKIFASNSPIGNFAQSSNTLQEFIDKTTQEFSLNEQAVLRIRPQLLNIYDSVKGQAATASEALATEREKLKANQDLLDSTNNYRQSISAALLDLETRLATEPMSSGQFAAGQRASRIATEEERRFETGGDAAVREYRSSFGRGFEEALGPIEEKTLDFKNELGREIPQLFSQNLAQGLNDAISGAKSLKDALRDAATSFLNAITQKNVENIANLVTGGIGNVAQSFFASGGQVNGGSGVKDDVPAMLMGGEYVIRKSAVKKYGSKFLDSLNNGGIKAFAKGGGVQSGRGGFYVPGDYGEGAITGKGQLLAFAGQSFTGGQYDQVGVSGMSGASINLESESARLTAFGRENSPMFERIQQAKEEAFNVYLNQLKQEEQYREQLKQIEEAEKARKKQLTTAIVSAVASSVLSYGATKLGQRFNTGKLNAQVDALNYGPQTSANLSSIGNSAGLRNMVAGAPLTSAAQTYSQGVQTNFTEPMLPVAGVGPNPLLPALNRNFPVDLAGQTPDGFFNPYPKLGRANGGPILGGSGVRDDVPAMLTGGEFVLNNRATRKLGVENLNRLNSGDVGGNSGQQVSEAVVSKLDELIKTTRESSKNNVVVNVSGMEGGMENKEKRADENKSNTEKELQRKIKDAVLAVLAQEKRLGGSLSK